MGSLLSIVRCFLRVIADGRLWERQNNGLRAPGPLIPMDLTLVTLLIPCIDEPLSVNDLPAIRDSHPSQPHRPGS